MRNDEQGAMEVQSDLMSSPSGANFGANSGADEMLDERILVLAAGERNDVVLCRILQAARLHCHLSPNMAALLREVSRGAGAVLISARTLVRSELTQLHAMLDQQPQWSDLPLVVLVEKHNEELFSPLAESTQVTLLGQPVRSFSLVSTLQAALRFRRRQYEARNLHDSLEQRVRKRTAQVHNLVTQLTLSEQSERRRISQILHDDLQQRLFSTIFQLSMARHALANEELESALQTLTEIEEAMGNAIEITRNLSVDLSPPILHSEGLVEAISWLASRMEQQHGLAVTVQRGEAVPTPDEDLRVLLFQGVRELLFNVVKHAGVATAVVALTNDAGQIRIEVIDQGQGFDIDTQSPETSQGLLRVQQRLQLIGGRMHIRTRPGEGTRVTLYTPLRVSKKDR